MAEGVPLTARLAGLLRKAAGPMALATVSQMISSVTNFLFVLSLVAQLDAGGFGLYSIAFAVVLAGTAVLQGFFQLQMVTSLPNLDGHRRSDFAAALFYLQIAATFVISAPFIVVVGAAFGRADVWVLSAATGIAILSLSGKEFLIRYLFASFRDTLWIPAMNLLASAALALMVFAGVSAGGADFAMLAFGLAQMAAMLLGLAVVRPAFRPGELGAPLREVSRNGAWGAFSALTYSARASAHTLIVGATLPLSEVGLMNAARTLLTPATLMIPTLSAVTLPRMSNAMADDGHAALRAMALRMALAMTAMVCVYAALLALCWPLLTRFVLGEDFADLGDLVALWSIFAIAIALRNVAEWMLQAAQSFRSLAMFNLLAAVATLVAVAILTAAWGITGAILGLILGEIFLIVVIAMAVTRFSRMQR